MSHRNGDNREQREAAKAARRDGESASEAGASQGAEQQIDTTADEGRVRDDDGRGKPGRTEERTTRR